MCKAAHKLLPVKVFLNNGLRPKLVYTCCLFVFSTGLTHAANLLTVDDNYGIPASRFLQIEPFGVLENDTLDDQNAGENGATVELLSSVANGTLNCPASPGTELCADGSFDYTPGPGFGGTDSFTYQAALGVDVSAPATVTLSACSGGPTIFTCWHKTPYLAKLSALGYNIFLEGFEGAAWEVVRSPDIGPSITASSITSKGITWTSNHPLTNGITTGSGPRRTGLWGGFDPAHGLATKTDPTICDVDVVPTGCRPHDGVSGKILSGGDKLHGVGGYITGFTNASISIILDGTPYNVGKLPDSGHHFYGVIDASSSGFSGFEFQEQDGKSGQELFIFSDDFFIATSAVVAVNNPPVLDMIDNQAVNEDVLLDIKLTASDPDDGDSWSFSMSGEPAGSSLNNNDDGTANFSWRPNFSQAGSYLVNVMVTDNGIPSQSDSTTITILVHDVVHPPGNLQFSAASYNVAENAGSATITVTRTGGSTGAASVNYLSSDVTAMAGSDYRLSSGTINFADGDTMAKTFIVSIIDDTIFEANETVNLALSGATGASLGALSSAVLNITENDTALRGNLQFSALTYTVTEEGTSATITVTRVGGSFGTVAVDYASADGSAMAGSDYTAVTGSLRFADSITSQTFSIDIIDDAYFEGDETLNLTLSHATGGADLGSPALAVLTISENDLFSDTGNNNVSTGGSGGGIDLITLILLLSLYRRKIPDKNSSNSTTTD